MRYIYSILISFLCIAAHAQPVASFSVSRNKVCSGTKVVLNNTSTGATTYSWYVNDLFFSNNIHDSVILVEPCYDLQPIRLIAFNNALADTHTLVVEVFDTCAMHLHGDYTNCVGDTIRKNAHPDAISHVWNIDPPHTLLSGCDTCDSISFVLAVIGTTVNLQSTYEGGCSQPVSYHYFMCNPLTEVGIAHAIADKVKIYPNPADGYLTIENATNEKINSITLYSSYGTIVGKYETTVSTVHIAHLAPGIYFIKLELPDGVVTKKIIKR